ncbi:roadblock/LC7 domain-containing protein [Streptomyces sp. NPDC051041]|uniref:roadblock/LC7 domain-containing protein n=1 Tax=Streptomyces sp. NPDC051041 TaxID=3365640 RepID=UPI0037AC1670
MTYDMRSETTPVPPQGMSSPEQIAWLLNQFVADEPDVMHALLGSRDGLKLAFSDAMTRDATDSLAAAISALSSLATNLPGLSGSGVPVRQMLVERDDCLFFIVGAGATSAFRSHPGNTQGSVDTVLGVISRPDADVGKVGFEMQRLVQRFAPYMVTAVRDGGGER